MDAAAMVSEFTKGLSVQVPPRPDFAGVVVGNRDRETVDFRATVTSSTANVFQKTANPQQYIAQRVESVSASPTARYSPLDRLPEQTGTGTNFSAELQRGQRSRTHSECSPSPTPTGTPCVESIPEHAAVNKPTRAPDLKVETLDDLKRAKKMLSKRMASDTDLWLTLQKTQERYAKMADKASTAPVIQGGYVGIGEGEGQHIFVNRVEMPPAQTLQAPKTASESRSGGPTPEEFNRRLKAKRAIFSNKRSLSLASFRFSVPSSVVPPLLKKKQSISGGDAAAAAVTAVVDLAGSALKTDQDVAYMKATQPRGELDLLNLESLINLDDVNKRSGGGGGRGSKGNTNALSISVTGPPTSSSGSSKGQRF